MQRLILLCAAAGAVAAAGCRHNPVYPAVGILYVSSYPSQAEVLVDGVTTHRKTPLRLDGLSEGTHRVTVRYFGYKATTEEVTIAGGMVERVAVQLPPVRPQIVGYQPIGANATDMVFEPVTGRVYVSNRAYSLEAFQVAGASFTPLPDIPIQWGNQSYGGSKLLAVNRAAGKLYAVLTSDSLVAVDLDQQQVVARFRLPDSCRCMRVRFSDDGRALYVADSLNHRIWMIDPRADTVAGFIALPGAPSDLVIDPSGDYLYVTILSPRLVAKVHARTGAVLNQSAAGTSPGGLFFDGGCQRLGFCNRTAKQVATVQLDPWTLANGPVIYDDADYAVTGVFAADMTHQWVLTGSDPYMSDDATVCDPGYIHLVYLPSQQHVFRYPVLANPVAMAQSADGRYLYILNRFSRSILIYHSDTE